MGKSTREKILEDFQKTLLGMKGIEKCEVGKISPVDLDTCPYPCAFVFPGPEIKPADKQAVGMETWEWIVLIEVWAKDVNMEQMIKDIHEELDEDYTRGGNALNCFRTGATINALDPTKSLVSILLDYEVWYRHPKGKP